MPANYVPLERIELNASAASVTFSNIPQSGYTDLKIVVSARSTTNGVNNLYWQINSTTTGYSERWFRGNGTNVTSSNISTTSFTFPIIDANDDTASTFGNAEIYIPNYNSTSTYKSISIDSVNENNVTTAYTFLNAGLWSNNAAITTLSFYASSGNLAAYSTFSLYGLAAVGTTPAIAPKATGGNITTDGTYWIHTFNATDTFTPQTNLTCDYLVVAGGGGAGGGGPSGGGGAGGFLTSTGFAVTPQAYTITVGAGGSGGIVSGAQGTNGTNSVFSSITATGGGKGGGYSTSEAQTGANGGSGGGGAGGGSGNAGGSASPSGQGNAGGAGITGTSNNRPAGGGGGAGAAGASASGSNGGNGGNGLANSYSGTSVTYAGGGGGGAGTLSSVAGTGGTGGGGNGSKSGSGSAGTVNLGGGGGGAENSGSGGNGGSGIVIIRYPMA